MKGWGSKNDKINMTYNTKAALCLYHDITNDQNHEIKENLHCVQAPDRKLSSRLPS